MTKARHLTSRHVTSGYPEERLSDVAVRMANQRAHHCVVISEDGTTFLGIIRLVDVARWTDPGARILADLVSPVSPVSVGADEPASEVATLFERHSLGEAAVFEPNGLFVGLITAGSVLEWTRSETKAIAVEGAEARSLAILTTEVRSTLISLLEMARSWSGAPKIEGALRRDLNEMAEAAEKAIHSADKAARSFRPQTVPTDTSSRAVLLHPILDQCIVRARGLMAAKRLFLSSSWDTDNDRVLGEHTAITHAFRGILDQAILLAPMGGRLRVETRAGDGGFCRVTVFTARDSGATDGAAADAGNYDETMTTVSFELYQSEPPPECSGGQRRSISS